MADEHEHPIRYRFTVYLSGFHLFGGGRLVFFGTHSSHKDGELLIHDGSTGAYHSINYTRVVRMAAEVVNGSAH
jgi:hypothetical protein